MESFLEGAPPEGQREKIRFGCLSWTYPDWLSSFYPPGTKPAEFLHLYSKIFDLVEIDSSFYRIPSPSTVKQWKEKSSREFLFTAKLPGKITHELRLVGIEHELERFEKTMGELEDKLACVIAQLPPFSKFESDFQKLEAFLGTTNPKIRYAIEFRNKSWLRDETYELLSKRKVCFVWSVTDRMDELPPRVTSDLIYLRFMGKFGEFKKFNKVQKDRSEVLEKWWKHLSEKIGSVNLALVLVSNHFSGFAPATVNELRKLAGKEEADWAILSSPD